MEELMQQARNNVSRKYDEMNTLDSDVTTEPKTSLFGVIDLKKNIQDKIEKILAKSVKETLNRSYTVKINEYIVNLASSSEVEQLLQACINRYDSTGNYIAKLVLNPERESNVLTAIAESNQEVEEEEVILTSAGFEAFYTDLVKAV